MVAYSVLESDMIHSLSLSTDKLKGTIQLLKQNTDLWHVGQDTVDLRMSRRTFARVQQYVPECRVLIDNVEEHVQQAEAQMFPARLQEEEVWAQSVLESVLNTKVICSCFAVEHENGVFARARARVCVSSRSTHESFIL